MTSQPEWNPTVEPASDSATSPSRNVITQATRIADSGASVGLQQRLVLGRYVRSAVSTGSITPRPAVGVIMSTIDGSGGSRHGRVLGSAVAEPAAEVQRGGVSVDGGIPGFRPYSGQGSAQLGMVAGVGAG
jgi:hypothetical protein